MDDFPAQQPEALHIFEHPLAASAAPVIRVPAMERASIWDKLIMMNLLEGLNDFHGMPWRVPFPLDGQVLRFITVISVLANELRQSARS